MDGGEAVSKVVEDGKLELHKSQLTGVCLRVHVSYAQGPMLTSFQTTSPPRMGGAVTLPQHWEPNPSWFTGGRTRTDKVTYKPGMIRTSAGILDPLLTCGGDRPAVPMSLKPSQLCG